MLLPKVGIAKTPIDIAEFIISCPACESDQWADVMVLSDYWFFFYVPVFPIGKETNVFCKKCGLKRYGSAFDEKLLSNYENVKRLYKHPWWTYTGIGIILSPFIIITLHHLLNYLF